MCVCLFLFAVLVVCVRARACVCLCACVCTRFCAYESLLMRRAAAPLAAALNRLSPATQGSCPPSLRTSLTGLLPDALLEGYFFYQRNGDPTLLHGYPIREDTGEELADHQMDHYLHVALFHLRRPRATGVPGWCALVTRKSLKDDGLDLNLLDLLYAPPGSPLHLLAQLLSRLDNLSHVLAWTPKRDRLSPTPEIKLVQLPRLQLSFECRPGPDGAVRLCSVDYTRLFVPLGHPTPQQRQAAGLLKGMPHGLLLTSESDELHVLLPNVAPCRPGPCLGGRVGGGSVGTGSVPPPAPTKHLLPPHLPPSRPLPHRHAHPPPYTSP